MPLDRKSQIGSGHAGAIVSDADQTPAAAIGDDLDPPRPGIDRIFHKFFHHACRALNDLARSNAVDDGFAELSDGHIRRLRLRFGSTVARIAYSAYAGLGARDEPVSA